MLGFIVNESEEHPMQTRRTLARPRVLIAVSAAALLAAATTAVSAQAGDTPSQTSVAASYGAEQLPAGFTQHRTKVGALGLHYVIDGHGPTVVLLHGYPQTWYMWRHV